MNVCFVENQIIKKIIIKSKVVEKQNKSTLINFKPIQVLNGLKKILTGQDF